MQDAVIVSAVRTAVGRGKRDGSLANVHPIDLSALVIQEAVKRADVDPRTIDDVFWGCAMPEGATGHNIARQAAIRAGLPVTTAGVTVNRFCSSGLQTIAMAAHRVIVDRVPVVVAGGLESISLVQNEHMNLHRFREAWLEEHKPEIYMSMIETAEVVARRYYISRERQDEYAGHLHHRRDPEDPVVGVVRRREPGEVDPGPADAEAREPVAEQRHVVVPLRQRMREL